MLRVVLVGCCLMLTVAAAVPLRADLVVVKLPMTNVKFVLQGKSYSSSAQLTVTFTHSASKQTFDLPKGADTEEIKLESLSQLGGKKLTKAKGNEEGLRAATVWNLEHGLLPEFHRGIDQLLAVNASEPFAVEAKRLREELAKPLPDSPEEAALLKEYGGETGKIVKTAHFVVIHHGEKADKDEVKRKRPEARAEQLEQLLEIFLMKCAERGLAVHVPTQRMKMVVLTKIPKKLVAENRAAVIDPNQFWAASQNAIFIDERSKVPWLDTVKKLQNDVQKHLKNPPRRTQGNNPPGGPGAGGAGGAGGANGQDQLAQMSAGLLNKLTTTVQNIMSIGIENHELESTSREAAYMFLANCGVVSPETPRWAKDGLATYFEFPAETGWLKIGDVGQVHDAWYKASLQDPERIRIQDIVTGSLHDVARAPHEVMRAETQSWALMLYLLQTNGTGVAQYLASFQSMPPDVAVSPEVLGAIFDQAFGEDRAAVENGWREYMDKLKPEYEVLKDDAGTSTTTSEN